MKVRLISITLALLILIAFASSCGKDDTGNKPSGETPTLKERLAALDETASKIDLALSSGDQTTFLSYFSANYSKYYQSAVQKNAPKLAQFVDVFKTRKLLSCNGDYAVYQVTYNGKQFEISMILDEDGNWKIKDM